MNDVIRIARGHFKPFGVANIANEIAKTWIGLHVERLRHFILLLLVSREDDQFSWLIAFEDGLDEVAPETAGAAL